MLPVAQTITDALLTSLKWVGIASGAVLAIGFIWVGLCQGYDLWVEHKERQAEEEEHRAERLAPVDFAEEIRVHDRSRRGPERVAGPESRTDRLPFSGRRGA